MLVGMPPGGTLTFDELCEVLTLAVFVDITVPAPSDTMKNVLAAHKA